MTREEAILKIEYIRDGNDFTPTDAQVKALDLAIEALQFAEHFDLLKEYQSLQEVVRCKDCIHWHSGEMGTGEVYETYCEMLDTETDENAFCSDGERREHDKR